MRILLIGQCTLHWGRMEFGNIGNYYIIEPFVRELHKNFPGTEIVTTFQLSKKFCNREGVSVLPMELYYGWRDDDLENALKELEVAEEYAKSGNISAHSPYIDEVIKSDLVIDFSGDIWGDNANLLGKDRFEVGLCKDRVAQLLGKKTAMIAGSPGPFGNKRTVALAKEVFENFDLVTNREPISTKLLEESGFSPKNVKSLACPAFLFEPSKDKQWIDKMLAEQGVSSKKPTIGFLICGWNFMEGPFDKWPRQDEEYNVFARVIEDVINNYGSQVVLMSHSNGFDIPPAEFKLKQGRDYPIIKQLQRVIKARGNIKNESDLIALDGVYDTWTTKAILGNFDMVVSGRIHAAVAALSQRIPTVIIDYGHEPKAHKLKGFAIVAGVEEYVADPAEGTDLQKKIDRCWLNRGQISQKLSKRIPEVQAMARENFTLLKELK